MATPTMNLPTNMPTNNNNNDGGRRSRVSTGRSNRQQWNSSRQSNRSRVGEMNRMFEKRVIARHFESFLTQHILYFSN